MTNKLPVVGKRYKRKETYFEQPDIFYDVTRGGISSSGMQWVWVEEVGKEYDGHSIYVRDFWDFFEELPEDNAETNLSKKPTTELSPEVKEAVDNLVTSINGVDSYGLLHWGKNLYDSAHNLLNALDKQFAINKIEDDCPAEVAVDEWNTTEITAKEESIWKDSDIIFGIYDKLNTTSPNNITNNEIKLNTIIECERIGLVSVDDYCLLKNDKVSIGKLNHDLLFKELVHDKCYKKTKFCTLTDFINDYEKMKLELKDLKERVKELEKCLKK